MIRAALVLAGLASAALAQESFRGAGAMDATIENAIRTGQIPGAVVLVGHAGKVIYQKAYGSRALVPKKEAMTLDTIFDVASLTKVVATTSAIMKLVEDGKVRLSDPVTQYIPEYLGGKTDITVLHLLNHHSGLRPDVDLAPAWSGYETGIQKAVVDRPQAAPNARFVYSDINFLLLGEIVRRVAGKPLPDYVRETVFAPLGMNDTAFQPPAEWIARIAPTETLPETTAPLRGVVHDPTTRFMGGVAGHAGLFSTAADLSKFAEMMLGMGEREGVRVFSPMTVRRFTSPSSPPESTDIRALGWDMDSRFSGNRGDLFPRGSYGHTGFTGTSMWIDPGSNSYVILLANSVHPRLRPAITGLRSRVASVAAAGLPIRMAAALPEMPRGRSLSSSAATSTQNGKPVLTGLDVMIRDGFPQLKGARVGIITNHTGIARDGRRNIDALVAGGVHVQAILSPEHGVSGTEDHENVADQKDAKTGLPVYSLYSGANRRPNPAMLKGIDTLVFDIQDVGVRFYTYICTMANAMEEAAKHNLRFVVLDRPNPITGERVEGPMLDPAYRSFVGCMEIPVRHGMTVGELASLWNDQLSPKARLEVVKMENWHRSDWFDATGLTWINPSPNMRSLVAASLYPGVGMLELARNYSVGRGTDAPFEQVGADWIRGEELARYLNGRTVPGIRVYPTQLQPTASNFAGKRIEGIRFVITDREAFPSIRFGLELGSALAKLFPGKLAWSSNQKLVGNDQILKALEAAEDPGRIEERIRPALEEFKRRRQKFLLY